MISATTTTTTATTLTFRLRVDTACPTIDTSRSVFVGNLPYEADENGLRQHFVNGLSKEKEGHGGDADGDDEGDLSRG
ncbi:MAG: hypothetical protein ACRENS_12355, partial [Candidatus Eiseniibacteriota bacterium]